MSRIRYPVHVHLRRLEDDGTWTIVRTDIDGDELVRWAYQQQCDGRKLPGLFETRDCQKYICAPGVSN